MMYEKYACCDICLMIGYGWIVGWTMFMVGMMLIVYNNELLGLVLLDLAWGRVYDMSICLSLSHLGEVG